MNEDTILFDRTNPLITNSPQSEYSYSFNKTNKISMWVDSIYNKMSLQEKVGQLFMVATYSNRDDTHTDSIKKLITNYHLGGLVFFQNDPVKQAILTNEYQSISKVPLMIGLDAEWGLKMRLDNTYAYPYNMTLGAIQDDIIIKKIGKQIGKHCKRIGVHVNFAPVVDINTNPKNPIICVRSYGEDKNNVAKKGIAFTKGIQDEGVLACAKHFPGHGDTATDSHKTLPTISFDAKRIDSVELYPFKQLFKNGVASVMVAHLNVPSLENTKGLPSSLSYTIVTDILKNKLGFKGLVFTDALNMKGAANYKKPGDVDLEAFKAGNDVLLFTENAPKAISLIIDAYNNNEISEERLAHSVKKILAAKFKTGLNKYKPIEIKNLIPDLNTNDNETLYKEAISKAITVIKNDDQFLPIKNIANKKIAYIKLGDGSYKDFLRSLQGHVKLDVLADTQLELVLKKLKKYDIVIIGYHQSNSRDALLLSKKDVSWIQKIAKNNTVIFNAFSCLYCLSNLSFNNIDAAVIAYENSEIAQKITAQIIFGKREASGKLPASINNELPVNFGIDINTGSN
ncbi:MAG: glycoside hydrolase family 3 C-terminal domain-containing protein [Bacteroidetes bacterium]|nr:glycoside hydrolase family 3 C-terminal domain-containing protein [Bacteroidota bacterium]